MMLVFISLLLPMLIVYRLLFKPVKVKKIKPYKVYNVNLLDKSGNQIKRYTYVR